MQLTRVFAEHIFQNFKKSAWETSLYASMCAWKRATPSIELMTHSKSHDTNYSLLKKTRSREVNRQRNTSNILLPLLFTIK